MKKSSDKALVAYFVLTFSIAWSIWITLGMYAPQNYLLVIVGALAPTFAGFLMVGVTEGKEGVRTLWSKLLVWRVNWKHYMFAILGLTLLVLLAMGLNRILFDIPWVELSVIAARFGIPEDTAALFFLYSPLIFLTTIFGGPLAEELGWRGYAQPRLQKKVGAGWAGLIIGLVWSLWHLPLFYFFPKAVAELPLIHYIPLVTALGVIFAWMYTRSKGSVLLCILLHTGVNFALGIFSAAFAQTDYSLLNIFVILTILSAILLGSRIWHLK